MGGSIEIFENPDRRRTLFYILLREKSESKQEELFRSDEDGSIHIILDDLISLIRERKSLYQRWTQRIGDKERQLSVPKKPLRKFIDGYLSYLIKKEGVHEGCHGGEVGWSVEKSLENHLPCKSALSFDLEKAFENISHESIFNFFYGLLDYDLPDREKENMAGLFSMLCSVRYSDRWGLPQGSSCSMALFNRILFSLDEELSQESKERGFRYTRWVDDITITSPKNVGIENFLGSIELTERYFPVAREKTFFQDGGRIYLLGHKICYDNRLEKNTKEEKLKNKNPAINLDEWFSESGTKRYKPWCSKSQ